MFLYAQIDSSGYCVSVSHLFAEVVAPHMIPIQSEDDVQPGDVYNDGNWTRPELEPETLSDTGPTPHEIQIQTLLNTEFLVVMAELSNL